MNIQVEFLNEVPEAPPPPPSLLRRFAWRFWFHTKRAVLPAHGAAAEIQRMYSFIWIMLVSHALVLLPIILLVAVEAVIRLW